MSRLALVAILPVALLIGQPSASATNYRPFCSSFVDVCTHTGPDAPVLRADVCWNGTYATLMGSACPTGTKPFHVDYGLVDALTGHVAGFVPHDDACSVAGLCLDFAPHSGGQESPICCNGSCWPGTQCQGGTIYYCHDGVSNDDGTVTCFNAEQI